MARGRPRKSPESTVDSGTESQVSVLTKQVEELSKKLNQTLALLSAEKGIEVNTTKEEMPQESYDNFDDVEISPTDYIRVISLCPFKLNLSRERGDKLPKKFEKFGDEKRIMYSDLMMIMENHPNFLKDGYFYIADKRVIRKHGLDDDIYKNLLNKEKIQMILDGNISLAPSLFESANQPQRELIAEIFIDKLAHDEKVDLNLIDKLTRISGIKIQEKANVLKAHLNLLANQ